jgi:hypothetical protein
MELKVNITCAMLTFVLSDASEVVSHSQVDFELRELRQASCTDMLIL